MLSPWSHCHLLSCPSASTPVWTGCVQQGLIMGTDAQLVPAWQTDAVKRGCQSWGRGLTVPICSVLHARQAVQTIGLRQRDRPPADLQTWPISSLRQPAHLRSFLRWHILPPENGTWHHRQPSPMEPVRLSICGHPWGGALYQGPQQPAGEKEYRAESQKAWAPSPLSHYLAVDAGKSAFSL